MPAQIEGITAYKKNKLFAAGIPTVGELLRNYPKDYRRFEPWRKGAPIQAGDFTQAVGEIKKVSPYSGGFRFSSAARDHPVPVRRSRCACHCSRIGRIDYTLLLESDDEHVGAHLAAAAPACSTCLLGTSGL